MPLPTQTRATIIILIKVQRLEKKLHFCNGTVGDCSQIVAHVNWFSLFWCTSIIIYSRSVPSRITRITTIVLSWGLFMKQFLHLGKLYLTFLFGHELVCFQWKIMVLFWSFGVCVCERASALMRVRVCGCACACGGERVRGSMKRVVGRVVWAHKISTNTKISLSWSLLQNGAR